MRNPIAVAVLAAGVVSGSAALSAPALPSSKKIVVSPPVVEVKDLDRRTSIGAPVQQVDVSQEVSYADLDLSNPADVKKLHRRIRQTAVRVCRDLRAAYPPEFYPKLSGGNCVDAAVHRAKLSMASLVSPSTSADR